MSQQECQHLGRIHGRRSWEKRTEHAEEECLGRRRAARDVDVDGDNTVAATDNSVRLVKNSNQLKSAYG